MTYNLHPIFVHFPIALLFVYSLIKLLPLQKWTPQVAWKHIEQVILGIGFIGALLSLATGETAEHLLRPNRQLVEAHSTFASLATFLYGAILAGECASLLNQTERIRIFIDKMPVIPSLLSWIERIFTHKLLSGCLALCALLALTITGLLGGVLVYGTTADPFAQSILNLLGINL